MMTMPARQLFSKSLRIIKLLAAALLVAGGLMVASRGVV
jgi:hypothetical protein